MTEPQAGRRRVRDATPADVRAIAEIRVASWRATYAGLIPEGVLAGMDVGRNEAWLTGRLADPSASHTLVVEDEGGVVGYALLGASRDLDAPGIGEVEAIYVAPKALGQGFGRALMEAALNRFVEAGFRAAILWVLTGNVPARRFYQQAGFVPDGHARMLTFDGTPVEEIRYRWSIG